MSDQTACCACRSRRACEGAAPSCFRRSKRRVSKSVHPHPVAQPTVRVRPDQSESRPPRPYQVEVSLQGFQTQTRGVTLQVSQTTQLDLQMGVAAVAEQVSVTAEAPVIDTASVSVGTVVTSRTVQEIPLNGRHFVDLG